MMLSYTHSISVSIGVGGGLCLYSYNPTFTMLMQSTWSALLMPSSQHRAMMGLLVQLVVQHFESVVGQTSEEVVQTWGPYEPKDSHKCFPY